MPFHRARTPRSPKKAYEAAPSVWRMSHSPSRIVEQQHPLNDGDGGKGGVGVYEAMDTATLLDQYGGVIYNVNLSTLSANETGGGSKAAKRRKSDTSREAVGGLFGGQQQRLSLRDTSRDGPAGPSQNVSTGGSSGRNVIRSLIPPCSSSTVVAAGMNASVEEEAREPSPSMPSQHAETREGSPQYSTRTAAYRRARQPSPDSHVGGGMVALGAASRPSDDPQKTIASPLAGTVTTGGPNPVPRYVPVPLSQWAAEQNALNTAPSPVPSAHGSDANDSSGDEGRSAPHPTATGAHQHQGRHTQANKSSSHPCHDHDDTTATTATIEVSETTAGGTTISTTGGTYGGSRERRDRRFANLAAAPTPQPLSAWTDTIKGRLIGNRTASEQVRERSASVSSSTRRRSSIGAYIDGVRGVAGADQHDRLTNVATDEYTTPRMRRAAVLRAMEVAAFSSVSSAGRANTFSSGAASPRQRAHTPVHTVTLDAVSNAPTNRTTAALHSRLDAYLNTSIVPDQSEYVRTLDACAADLAKERVIAGRRRDRAKALALRQRKEVMDTYTRVARADGMRRNRATSAGVGRSRASSVAQQRTITPHYQQQAAAAASGADYYSSGYTTSASTSRRASPSNALPQQQQAYRAPSYSPTTNSTSVESATVGVQCDIMPMNASVGHIQQSSSPPRTPTPPRPPQSAIMPSSSFDKAAMTSPVLLHSIYTNSTHHRGTSSRSASPPTIKEHATTMTSPLSAAGGRSNQDVHPSSSGASPRGGVMFVAHNGLSTSGSSDDHAATRGDRGGARSQRSAAIKGNDGYTSVSSASYGVPSHPNATTDEQHHRSTSPHLRRAQPSTRQQQHLIDSSLELDICEEDRRVDTLADYASDRDVRAGELGDEDAEGEQRPIATSTRHFGNLSEVERSQQVVKVRAADGSVTEVVRGPTAAVTRHVHPPARQSPSKAPFTTYGLRSTSRTPSPPVRTVGGKTSKVAPSSSAFSVAAAAKANELTGKTAQESNDGAHQPAIVASSAHTVDPQAVPKPPSPTLERPPLAKRPETPPPKVSFAPQQRSEQPQERASVTVGRSNGLNTTTPASEDDEGYGSSDTSSAYDAEADMASAIPNYPKRIGNAVWRVSLRAPKALSAPSEGDTKRSSLNSSLAAQPRYTVTRSVSPKMVTPRRPIADGLPSAHARRHSDLSRTTSPPPLAVYASHRLSSPTSTASALADLRRQRASNDDTDATEALLQFVAGGLRTPRRAPYTCLPQLDTMGLVVGPFVPNVAIEERYRMRTLRRVFGVMRRLGQARIIRQQTEHKLKESTLALWRQKAARSYEMEQLATGFLRHHLLHKVLGVMKLRTFSRAADEYRRRNVLVSCVSQWRHKLTLKERTEAHQHTVGTQLVAKAFRHWAQRAAEARMVTQFTLRRTLKLWQRRYYVAQFAHKVAAGHKRFVSAVEKPSLLGHYFTAWRVALTNHRTQTFESDTAQLAAAKEHYSIRGGSYVKRRALAQWRARLKDHQFEAFGDKQARFNQLSRAWFVWRAAFQKARTTSAVSKLRPTVANNILKPPLEDAARNKSPPLYASTPFTLRQPILSSTAISPLMLLQSSPSVPRASAIAATASLGGPRYGGGVSLSPPRPSAQAAAATREPSYYTRHAADHRRNPSPRSALRAASPPTSSHTTRGGGRSMSPTHRQHDYYYNNPPPPSRSVRFSETPRR